MVSPINYMLDVVNPMTAAMAGYSTGKTERINQQVTEQNMQLAATEEARAAEKFAIEKSVLEEERRANQIAVAQAAEAKRRGQVYMDKLVELGTLAKPIDYANAIEANPEMAQAIQARGEILGAERVAGETKFGQQLFTMLLKNPDAAPTFLEERRAAAENAGDQETVDTTEAYIKMLNTPEGQDGVRALVGSGLFGIMGKDQFTAFANQLGVGEDTVEGASPLGKIAQDVNSGLIPKSVLDLAIAVDKRSQAGGLTPEAKAAEEKQIRGEWTKLSSGVSDARRNYSIIETSAADDSGAGDIALVTSFMKMLDPTSVVRETEFATARDSGGLFAKLQSYVSRIEDGKFLTPEQRTDFKRLSSQYLKAAEDQVAPVRSSYEKLIDNYGLNPENIFVIGNEPAAQPPALPESFTTSKAVTDAAAAQGTTPEAMWTVMTPEQRAVYGG